VPQCAPRFGDGVRAGLAWEDLQDFVITDDPAFLALVPFMQACALIRCHRHHVAAQEIA
jgi:hypothetical protein